MPTQNDINPFQTDKQEPALRALISLFTKQRDEANAFLTVLENDGRPNVLNVHNNSFAFHRWLNDNGIKFKPNGHYTSIPYSADIWTVAGDWALYEQANNPTKKPKESFAPGEEAKTLYSIFGILSDSLVNQKDYFYAWQANIAMTCFDEVMKNLPLDIQKNYRERIHKACNDGAINFLNQLTRDASNDEESE